MEIKVIFLLHRLDNIWIILTSLLQSYIDSRIRALREWTDEYSLRRIS